MANPGSVARGRTGQGSRLRARAEDAVVSIPRPRRGERLEFGRLVPSARSLSVGIGLLGAALVAYVVALSTGLFAVRTIAVDGVRGAVAADVRTALAEANGSSLVGLDLVELRARVEALPTVQSATFDRAFPHTLAVAVSPERGAAVLRRGADSWLVSVRGRVMTKLDRGARRALPRIWVGRDASPQLGETLGGEPAAAVRAVAPLAGSDLPLHVASALATQDELTLVLRSGLRVRLGDSTQLPLKLAVAANVVERLDAAAAYLDVSVPDRPVAGAELNPQAEVETEPSSGG